jgi:chloride channel protein, CIC family
MSEITMRRPRIERVLSRLRMPERDALRALRLRWQRTLVVAGAVGVVTGLSVTLFEWVTARLIFDHVLQLPRWGILVVPGAGLLIAWIALHFVAHDTPSTSDEFIRNYHESQTPLPLRPVFGRLLAGVATLGSGGAMGYEGPSIYLGAAVGSLAARLTRRGSGEDPLKVLMVAGAAAGVAAIFKTPATGVLFALEVPFREDLAADAVLPTVIAAVTSYLVFVSFYGTAPLFPVAGNPTFNARDLLGAAALGIVAGLGAHLFALAIGAAKRLQERIPGGARWVVGGVGLAILTGIAFSAFGAPLSLGSGYDVIAWIADPRRSASLVALLLVVRFLATSVTVTGGGAGGLFIPLVVLGALVGKLFGIAAGTPSTLFPVIGAAAFLGAGYRTPLAALMFVAESTGRPGFVIPGLIATALAQLVMGGASVSAYQERGRRGHMERRLRLRVSDVMVLDAPTAVPSTTVDDLLGDRFHADTGIPVLDGDRLLGVVHLRDAARVPPNGRRRTFARDLVHEDEATAAPDWTLRRAAAAMREGDVDVLAVVDADRFVGVVRMVDIVRIDDALAGPD